MAWEDERPAPRCEMCGRNPVSMIVLTTTAITVTTLDRPEAETTAHSTRRALCRPCAVPAAFANSQGVQDVLEGRATATIVRIPTGS